MSFFLVYYFIGIFVAIGICLWDTRRLTVGDLGACFLVAVFWPYALGVCLLALLSEHEHKVLIRLKDKS